MECKWGKKMVKEPNIDWDNWACMTLLWAQINIYGVGLQNGLL